MTLTLDSIETLAVRIPTRADFRWNGLERPLGEVLIVRVTAGDAVGYGETVPLPDWGGPFGSPFGESTEIAEVVLHDLVAPQILARDASQLAEIRASARGAVLGYPYALGALDVALHDLVARSRGLPVYDLLGGRVRESVPVAHMIGLMDTASAIAEAEAALAEGCRAFQVKGGQNVAHDVDLVARLRTLAGPDVSLRLDANCGYGTPKEGIAAANALADAGVTLIEQPVGDLLALARVTERSPVPIVADEACWSPEDALAVAATRGADAVSVYVAKAGGLAGAATIAAIAAAARLPHDLNGSLEAGIGNAASLQVAVASNAVLLPCVIPVNGPADDLPTKTFGRYFIDDIIAAGMTVRDGALVVSDAPGLGVEVDEERLERFTTRSRRSTVSDHHQEVRS